MCSYAVDEESEEVFDAADMTYFTAKLESVVQLDNVVLLGDNCGERVAKDGKLYSIVDDTVFYNRDTILVRTPSQTLFYIPVFTGSARSRSSSSAWSTRANAARCAASR